MRNRGAVDRAWLRNQASLDELSNKDRPNLYLERSDELADIVACAQLLSFKISG